MNRVIVTGASGFVGAALLERLSGGGLFFPVPVFRDMAGAKCVAPAIHVAKLSDLKSEDFRDCFSVIHCAARAHVKPEDNIDPLAGFRSVNVDCTLELARQCAISGVRRFIFISSIKVNGEGTSSGQPYCADDVPSPQDPYGISKLEAEQGLIALAKETGMEVVVIRPVLVYGPGVKANFRSMMDWICKGVPLPLGAISNRRSLVSIDNLVDLIVTCIDHPRAANQTFLVADGEDLSTTELLRRMGRALGKPAWLLPVPVALLNAGAVVLGKRAIATRLCSSLQVDISKTHDLLGWAPPFSMDEGLRRTAEHYLTEKG